MTAGYSGKPAYQKLGLKDGLRCLVLAEPGPYLPLVGAADVALALQPAEDELDFVHLFVTEARRLAAELPRLKGLLQPAGMIWVSWPKKAAKMETDVTEDVIRQMALAEGLVDVKVCAVDQIWSGLKLVIPRKDRPKHYPSGR